MAEQPGEDLGLGLAQLGELLGDVGDRAVVLAHLRAVRCRPDRRSVAVAGQRPGEGLGPLLGGQPGERGGVTGLQLADPAPGELVDGPLTAGLGEVAQRADGEVVVGLLEGVASAVGEAERPRGPATAARRPRSYGRVGDLGEPVGDQVVEVAADTGRGQPERLGELAGGGHPPLQQRARHPLTRGRVRRGLTALDFHNTSVPLFGRRAKRKPRYLDSDGVPAADQPMTTPMTCP